MTKQEILKTYFKLFNDMYKEKQFNKKVDLNIKTSQFKKSNDIVITGSEPMYGILIQGELIGQIHWKYATKNKNLECRHVGYKFITSTNSRPLGVDKNIMNILDLIFTESEISELYRIKQEILTNFLIDVEIDIFSNQDEDGLIDFIKDNLSSKGIVFNDYDIKLILGLINNNVII